MEPKLNKITTQYHTYKKDQVLTHTQLNESIDYFEDQVRLSRISLSGVGIVCGFKIHFNPADNSITITQGTGVTTDGDLLKLREDIPEGEEKNIDVPEVKYTAFKPFIDDKVAYPPFLTTGDEQIELSELIPENKVTDETPLNDLANIENKVVVLYLENYAKDLDLCSDIDCDNQGTEQVARLRVLLVSQDDADHIITGDSIYKKYFVKNIYNNLRDVALKRVILNEAATGTFKNLQLSYYNAIVDNNIINHLREGFKAILLHYDLATDNAIIQNRINKWFTFNKITIPLMFQYRYDLLKDLVATYTELKELFIRLTSECCPDIAAFPKHLMLGKVVDADAYKSYRHQFYKSPVLNDCDYGKKFISLVERAKNIVNNFQLQSGDIKLTPSLENALLGHKAIPFYYQVNEELLKSWNYYKTSIYKQKNNLSYHTGTLENIPQVQQPLQYGPDTHDFYRIEGHQGKHYAEALEEIEKIKTTNSLAFDVKALSIGLTEQDIDPDDYECEFEDLQVLLRAWTAEQECILAKVSSFFSGFSITQPGTHVTDSLAVATEASFQPMIAVESARTVEKPLSYKTTAKSAVVEDHLIVREDALGNIVKQAIDQNKGGSVNDIIADAGIIADNTLDDEIWGDNQVKSFLIDDSIKVLAYSHVLSQKMPEVLKSVDDKVIASYNLTLEQLCARVKQLQSIYQNVELPQNIRAFYGLLITQLASICCSGKKLKLLLEEIEARKEKILLQLQLSGFAEKHPGLEHHAGVRKGGTFVLVYLSKRSKITNTNDLRAIAPNLGGRMDIFAESIPEINPGSELLEIPGIDSGKFLGKTPVVSIPEGTVIADFSLPYLCCSDCSPINFIVPKPVVFLRLEKATYCIGTDESPLLFEVSPEDGIIKADEEIEGLTIEGKELTIDGDSFPDTALGTEIHFTVNDQLTDVSLTVYKTPVFDFEVPENPVSAEASQITFTPAGSGLKDANFLWDFGDGTTSEDRNPTHTYQLPVNEENTVTVSLTVTPANGACPDTVEHTIIFEEITNEACIEETESLIRQNLQRMEQFPDIDPRLREAIVKPTAALYNKVLEDTEFLNGARNNQLEKMFVGLLRETAGTLLQLFEEDPDSFKQIAVVFIMQIELLYHILHCQPVPTLEKDKELIASLLAQVTEILQTLFKRRIFFDSENELKAFLQKYVFDMEAAYIKKIIHDQLDAIL